jgi:putative transcriptional regulator
MTGYGITGCCNNWQAQRRQKQLIQCPRGQDDKHRQADIVGVTRQTIIAIEQGKYSPSLSLGFRIALAFGVPLESVFQYGPESP